MEMLRIEKGYRCWGAEVTTEVMLHATALARFGSTGKDDIGRRAVDADRQMLPPKHLVALDVGPAKPLCWGTEPGFSGNRMIGRIRLGRMRWRTNEMVTIDWIQRTKVALGQSFSVKTLLER